MTYRELVIAVYGVVSMPYVLLPGRAGPPAPGPSVVDGSAALGGRMPRRRPGPGQVKSPSKCLSAGTSVPASPSCKTCGRRLLQLPAPFKPDVSRTFSALVSTNSPFPALFGPFWGRKLLQPAGLSKTGSKNCCDLRVCRKRVPKTVATCGFAVACRMLVLGPPPANPSRCHPMRSQSRFQAVATPLLRRC